MKVRKFRIRSMRYIYVLMYKKSQKMSSKKSKLQICICMWVHLYIFSHICTYIYIYRSYIDICLFLHRTFLEGMLTVATCRKQKGQGKEYFSIV